MISCWEIIIFIDLDEVEDLLDSIDNPDEDDFVILDDEPLPGIWSKNNLHDFWVKTLIY